MNPYSICTDIYTIVAGTNNSLSPVFKEAANDLNNATPKGFGYLKNFIISIEELSNKTEVKDKRISESRGNIKAFKGYKNIESAISFLNKYLKGIPMVNECTSLLNSLEKYQSLYAEAYDKNTRLVVLEYENAVYLLVTSLSMIIANNMDVVSNGTEIRIQKKAASTFGVIDSTLTKLAKELSNYGHKEYLETMIKKSDEVDTTGSKDVNDTEMHESTYMESVVGETLSLVSSILTGTGKVLEMGKKILVRAKRTLFGIIPLIRSIIFLRYKKKADTIVGLEEQVEFIQQNIEHLENRKNIDPKKKAEIIKKQQAVIEAYKKKAAKLRAEICEQEKDAATEIKKNDEEIKDTDDDDFIIENVMFSESVKYSKLKKRMKTDMERTVGVDNSSNKPTIKTTKNHKETEELVKKVLNDIIEETKKPSIRLVIPKKHEKKDDILKKRTITKIGGIPYWPNNMKWPEYNGKPLICIAQLNFEELPKLPDFPTKGILQFFVCERGCFSSDTIDGKKKNIVIYHDKILPEDEWYTVDDSHTSFNKGIHEKGEFPFTGVYFPTFKVEEVPMNSSNEKWDELYFKNLNKHFKQNWKEYFDVPKEIRDLIWENFKKIDYAGTRIGGNPYFCHYDMRKHTDTDILLLQIDSESGIIWGDCGIANAFISSKDLKKKNFNKVYFTYDCY